ncbi:cell division protein [Chryseobacterium lactis]|uniref:Cell division protein n=1 Tax=Chryseobacterium lactis TaxID=1241981 RepID=A0A3G6RNP5_CHRLC|nr:SRPBCC family protein [Chryseobacterium lactis]AZA84451.1 cell division protein [Chryseobacterium lactis]AZB04839.1 cell division protein [Chryseobacterium lactis]PNW14570.1 cell division protein [Chryseobacterium lactis]
MSTIYLETLIDADIDTVFDLARNIDLHQKSTARSNERAIAGRTSGLIEENETVTWRAKHLGIYQNLTTKIISMEKPLQFTDVMQKGAFKSLHHQHIFKETEGKTLMTDIFEFESPLGILGNLFNRFFLKQYLKNFLLERNELIKTTAESLRSPKGATYSRIE